MTHTTLRPLPRKISPTPSGQLPLPSAGVPVHRRMPSTLVPMEGAAKIGQGERKSRRATIG